MARATGLKFRPIAFDFEEMTNIIEGMPSYFWLTSSRLRKPLQDDVPYTTQALRQDLLRVRNAWDECQAHRERDAIYSYLTAVFDLVAWWASDTTPSAEHIGRYGSRVRTHQLPTNRSPPSFSPPLIVKKSISERDPSGRACCGMQRSARRTSNRLPRSFGGKAASIDVLRDLPVASVDMVETER
jgi:hypothetical protein